MNNLTPFFAAAPGAGSTLTGLDWLAIAFYFGILACVAWWVIHVPGFYGGSQSQRAGALLATIVISTATYLGSAFVMRVREIPEVWRIYFP